jgi:hypothetical protein
VEEAGRAGPREAQVRLFRHGRERQPVIVIDDFAADPGALVEAARGLPFRPIGANFPGVRHPTPPPMVAEARARLTDLIQQVFDLAEPLNRIESYYSLVTTPPDRLTPIQRLPHFDGLGAQRIALVHHLSRAEQGATSFFRHRATGFETIDAARLPVYNRAVNLELMRGGPPPAGYLDGDTPIYERIGRYAARYNRLLIYRGATLHGAEAPGPLTDDPATGRFSINTFIWLEPG